MRLTLKLRRRERKLKFARRIRTIRNNDSCSVHPDGSADSPFFLRIAAIPRTKSSASRVSESIPGFSFERGLVLAVQELQDRSIVRGRREMPEIRRDGTWSKRHLPCVCSLHSKPFYRYNGDPPLHHRIQPP
ncbi:hypothetical protein IscW_ISCW010209 [Ixodes scapularis]|uniref:Uncharacterized protein n=1 Tax=Ixodes scapularis TaxID=6945 RepID=B7Q002_IXOSC|nr:hypothetical protein IscW_ISCW010209 [Ixodes scapularis]|eukprot:XP_002406573.1 hypothetical protein IscW_ISCW010209 [Ixodes scapularis]